MSYPFDFETALDIPGTNCTFIDNVDVKEFYLLSPDGFTLTPDAASYTSIRDAKKDFDNWMLQYANQDYYSSNKYGRIELEDLWEFMVLHDKIFFDLGTS